MLKQRVLTALVLVGGLLGLLFAAPPLWAHIAFAVLASIGAWEWSTLLRAPVPMRVGYSALVALACAALALSDPTVAVVVWSAATVFWLALVPLWLAGRWTLLKTPLLGHALGLLLLVATWAALVELLKRGPWALLGILAIVWVADIAAYFFGRAFGKHKLAPSISPGKTWEGAARKCPWFLWLESTWSSGSLSARTTAIWQISWPRQVWVVPETRPRPNKARISFSVSRIKWPNANSSFGAVPIIGLPSGLRSKGWSFVFKLWRHIKG